MSQDLAQRRPLLQGLNLVWILTCRNFMPRNEREGAKFFWILIDPIAAIVVISLIFSLIGRGAPYGDNLALFLTTGIAMTTHFLQLVLLVSGAVVDLRNPNRLAVIGVFHEALARSLFKLVISLLYFSILIFGIEYVYRLDIVIFSLSDVMLAFVLMTLTGFGWGLVIGYASVFMSAFAKLYSSLSRGVIFVSGVFFMPSFMPPTFREVLSFNPIMQAIELFRRGVYPDYPSIVLDTPYLAFFALGTVALGMTLTWTRRTRLLG